MRIISQKILKKEVMLKLVAKHLIIATIMINKAMMILMTKKMLCNMLSNKRVLYLNLLLDK